LAKILRVDPLKPDREALREAAEAIKRGELVAFPTETVYGLGADSFNGRAVRRIYEAKGRPLDNPVIAHIENIEQLYELAPEVPDIALKLAEKFWPGPMTIILKRDKRVPPEVSAYLPTVSIRMPAHPVALGLIEESGTPIAAPSANLSSRPSPTSAAHVIEDLGDRIEVILDGGETIFGVESTIIDLLSKPPRLLRPGALPVEELRSVLGEVAVTEVAIAERPYSGVAEAPGMRYRHYAPKAPMVVVEGTLEKAVEKIRSLALKDAQRGLKVGVLATDETVSLYPPPLRAFSLGSREEPYSIAHNLFHYLRLMDKLQVDKIYGEGFPQKGILFAVSNRMRKASGYQIIKVD